MFRHKFRRAGIERTCLNPYGRDKRGKDLIRVVSGGKNRESRDRFLPKGWQRLAKGLALYCQKAGTVLPTLWQDVATIVSQH